MNVVSGKEYRENLLKTFIEIKPPNQDNFLKIRETLTRIGIANNKTKTLYQTCHILHKQGRYWILHFKELFALDGKAEVLSSEDRIRRNNIALTLEDWELIELLSKIEEEGGSSFTILKHAMKKDWTLQAKYSIGGEKVKQG